MVSEDSINISGGQKQLLTIARALLADLHPAFDPARYAKFLEFFSLHGSDVLGRLSTGQRARVELAAGFAKRVPYYLMDEPFLCWVFKAYTR